MTTDVVLCASQSAGLRLDDLVATPVGAGYLRGYRREDGFCIVLYPWGHGFVHLRHVARLEQAIETQRKKRKFNEFLALEHQHLYEEVESLLENYPPEQDVPSSTAKMLKITPEGVDVDEYTKLVESLQEEEVRRNLFYLSACGCLILTNFYLKLNYYY